MVRKIVILVGINMLLSSCSSFVLFTVKPYADISTYNLIDTAAFYFSVKGYNQSHSYERITDPSFGAGMKFYAGGKMVYKTGVKFDNISTLNPKKSISKGYYSISDTIENKEIEFKARSPQSGAYLIKLYVSEIKGDTLILYSKSQDISGKWNIIDALFPPKKKRMQKQDMKNVEYSLYIKKKLPKEALIFTPGW